MAKLLFTDHRDFMRVSSAVSAALTDLANQFDCLDALHALRPHTDRVADDMTKLLLRACDHDHNSETA